MKKSGGREFFEVFRRLPERETPPVGASKKPEAAAPKEANESKGSPDATPLRRDAPASRDRIALSVSREAAVVSAVVAAFALVASFVLGWYARGPSSRVTAGGPGVGTAASSSRTASAPSTGNRTALSVTGQRQSAYYTLRLMSGINLQRAQEVVSDLRAMSYHDAFVLREGNTFSVNAGHYDSDRSAEAKAFKEKMNTLVYKNRRWFTACVWHKVTE